MKIDVPEQVRKGPAEHYFVQNLKTIPLQMIKASATINMPSLNIITLSQPRNLDPVYRIFFRVGN